MLASTRPQVGIDTQCLSYVIDALSEVAAPTDALAPQKLALVRLFFYLPETLWVTPKVTEECAQIRNVDRAELHASFIRVLFGEMPVRNPVPVATRATDLTQYHNGGNDCIIVAEAEAAGHGILLSFDSALVRHLAPHTVVQLIEPAQYWNKLALPKGSTPNKIPHATNPLSSETWWRW